MIKQDKYVFILVKIQVKEETQDFIVVQYS